MQEVSELNVPAAAPGCYASPSVFASDSDVCRGCPVFGECSNACVQTLHAIRDRINVDSLLERHRAARHSTIEAAPRETPELPKALKFLPSIKPNTEKVDIKPVKTHKPRVAHEATPEQLAIIDRISQAHAKDLALKWCRAGLIETIGTELSAGRNPFASEPQTYYAVACEELLKGPLTRNALKEVFTKRMGKHKRWDVKTALSHVGIVIPALVGFGFAIETPAGFVVNPKIGRDNV